MHSYLFNMHDPNLNSKFFVLFFIKRRKKLSPFLYITIHSDDLKFRKKGPAGKTMKFKMIWIILVNDVPLDQKKIEVKKTKK